LSKNNVRIAIRDSTDSHNVAFFDNKAGIKYKSANLHRFLAGSASILTIKYNSKDIDSIRSGCKLAFHYKNRDYWLNVMTFEKKGFEVELTAYSLGLELNNETRGEHKPATAMSIAEYVAYYDPEHALTIGVNEVSDKRIKLEWTGTDTILARLFSVANSFGAELDFNVELNDDYSLKRQVLNIYKKGNLGTNKVSQPVRVGKELKVINYSDNIKELRTAVRATGKDGLTIDGLNKKIYDNNKELLYYSSGMTVYAPQSRDRFPSVGKGSNDNWIVKDLGETQYETKEALWGYMYGEIQKISVPEITYEVEGAIDAGIGDTQTLIDDIHFEPALYVQARVSELEDDILTGKVTNSTFINFERKYSQIADSLLKQVEALAEDAAPYIVRLSTDNGYNFKNGQGTSTITAKLEKYSKIVNAKWKWLINNSVVSETSSVKINASQVNGTLNVVAVAIVGGNEAAREYITFTNADDGVGIKSITRYYTTNDKAEGVTAGGQNWSTKPTTPTADKKYMWSYDVITYTNDTSLVTKPAVIGVRGDDGLDADTTGITEALDKAKQQLNTVSNDLIKAKTDLQTQASQLQAQANAQSELTKRVSSVEETANGTKTTVSELSKTVDSNTQNITSVTARTKTVEDDLTSTKTTLSQVKTTADNTSKKTATLETGLNGVKADLTATTTTANTTKTNLANYQASNDKAVANLQSNLQTANGNISSLQTKVEAVPGQITSAVSAVEGKILTSVGGRNFWIQSKATGGFVEETLPDNHVTGQKKCYRILNNQKIEFDIEPDFSSRLYQKVTFSAWVKYENVVQGANGWNKFEVFKHTLYRKNSSTGATSSADPVVLAELVGTSDWKYVTYTYDYSNNKSYDQLKTNLRFVLEGVKSGTAWVTGIKVEIGSIPSDYSPAPEDTVTQISNLSSRIQQTADGMTLLATKTELNSAKTELQSGITTATNKANAAQNTANNNAKTISTHTTQISALNTGLSAKVSQTDFNTLSGRVTTAENNIIAKANELSSKITSVEGKIPTTIGGRNLLTKTNQGKTNWNWTMQAGDKTIESVSFEGINAVKLMKGTATPHSGFSVIYCGGVLSKLIESDTQYTLSFDVYPSVNVTFNATLMDSDSSDRLTTVATMNAAAANKWTKVSCILTRLKNLPANIGGQVVYLTGMSSANGVSYIIKNIKLEKGNIPTDWTPAPEDYDSKLASAQSEIKQTTDAITASVSSVQTAASNAQSTANTAVSKADAAQAGVNTLDNTTVKSASLTINTDGIVMKAGKSTTDVANAIGSYFAVNQNAINLFSDKISVKGSMIVDGAITSNKIASKSINTAHLNGKIITADVISSNAITADAIKAGAVTTDKMTANSINGDRITAGTLDAAKIKAGSITASQIASGTITSAQIKTGTISAANIAAGAITTDKIAANSINSSKIVSSGITANVIKGGKLQSLSNATNFELDTGKLFYNNNNTGIFRVQANASTMGLKFSNTSITVSGTSRILSRVILGGDRRETSLDDGKWDQGGFTGIVAETINDVDSNAHSQADTLRVIGDNIYFTHSYNYDAQTKTSAQGWKMETFSPFSSYAGNVVLKPYGINYRQSDIITGDVRLDNGDGSGYWVRGCIRTLRNCFQHYLNGGTTSGAMNAIRDALKEISGV
jgi:predicted  nucleic acid-binding Zn-ribbon protein